MDSVLSRLLEVVRADHDRLAVVDGTCRITFGELLIAAQRIAGLIRDDAGPLVGIRMGRSWAAIAAMIGVLISGRAYVPIDPSCPDERQRYLESDARLSHIITDEGGDPRVQRRPDSPVPAHIVPAGTMYVIYTSGSTGAPKGVVVTQANVTSLLTAAMAVLPLRDGLRWSAFHSLSFDFSVWEIWGALLSGGCAVLVDRESAIDPPLTADLLARERVNVLSMVPSGFAGLLREVVTSGRALPDLTCVVLGGEAVRLGDVVEWWRARVSTDSAMINMYGITETTVHVTQCLLTPELIADASPGRTPIGSPLPNAQVQISVDGGATTCVVGEPGEIIVSGAGVAVGYLGRPVLTAERFPELDGKHSYCSGDWGVRTPEGTLLYVGRVDDQVKIRGYRIELGEIEGVLARHDDVAAAACVVYCEPDRSDRLVACIVGRGGAPDTRSIRRWLASKVPSYLMPARIIGVDDLPTTESGKVDRNAVAALAADSFRTSG